MPTSVDFWKDTIPKPVGLGSLSSVRPGSVQPLFTACPGSSNGA